MGREGRAEVLAFEAAERMWEEGDASRRRGSSFLFFSGFCQLQLRDESRGTHWETAWPAQGPMTRSSASSLAEKTALHLAGIEEQLFAA